MKKYFKYIGGSIIVLLTLSFLTNSLSSTVFANTDSSLKKNEDVAIVNNFKNDETSDMNFIYDEGTKILTYELKDNAITYTANDVEYEQGAHYAGTISLINDDNNEISAGTQLILGVSSKAVDYETLDLTDPQIKKFFDIKIDKENEKIIFTLKIDIVGQANISFVVGGVVVGEKGKKYDVTVSAVDTKGISHSVLNNNPSLLIHEDEITPPPVYGMINAFWGINPDKSGQYIGKNKENIDGLPTGRFSRSSDEIQNFVQINPLGTYRLSKDYHYLMAWIIEPYGGQSNVNINLNDVIVCDDVTGKEIDKSWYTIFRDSRNPNEIWIEFQSPLGTGDTMNPSIRLRISFNAHVSNDAIRYHSDSYLYIKTDAGGVVGNTYEFPLNNFFTDEGESNVFPNLKVEDKTFYVGYLNNSNIKKEILKNIIAKDTLDGDISQNILVDYSKVNPNLVGDYRITYTVVNSTGHVGTKTAIVHIIERKNGAPVTISYIDEDGKSISPDIVLNGKLGESYESKAIIKDGYELISTPDNAKGTFTEKEQKVTYVYRGHLIFVDAPKIISFGKHVLSDKDEIYFIQSKKNDLKVQDFRKLGSNWSLRAQLKTNFIGEKLKKKLEGVLNFTNEKGEKTEITDHATTLIYSATTENHDIKNLSEGWSDKQGLSLDIKTGGALLDNYNANIEWTISDMVPNK
ncbi:hypothetical protein BH746_11750 [Enterococcus faecalis]|uniref:MucBP domain-containing protein n=1 Tax=Enterococcus faecalis TaxID=1351 RepID=UPI0009BF4696|nr:MucBP domain-containing protein [Enterococcus faecalis]OQO72569.1 hypothetical protein BH746_11750 [Enterococcus faecalis]